MGKTRAAGARLVELRILEGPNLYFTGPAVKLTLELPAWMQLSTVRLAKLAERMDLSTTARPGEPGTQQRQRYLARIAAHLTRALAAAGGTHLAVRGRTGVDAGQVVIAYPWRRRGTAEALGYEVSGLLQTILSDRRRFSTICAEVAERLEAVPPGAPPSLPVAAVPVIMVSGTNGKTTTVRLIAHFGRAAGLSVAYTSTDGVFVDDRVTTPGDYSGFSGAAEALAQPGIGLAVLEVARGGILLRGIGTARNDVAVVTNVSEDHLDQHGIRTLDQLAEVKAAITRITKPDGWDVLNADDPRVLSMRRHVTGHPWIFSLDVDHPAIRATLAEKGRALTVVDGFMVVMRSYHDADSLVLLEDVPVTLFGIARQYVQNALAATAAALGAGIPEEAVVQGLRSFRLDPDRNPGRANLFELEGRVVVVDYAHNEEGMKGLVEICQGLRVKGSRIWLAFGSAGDRTNAILHRLAYTAARGADRVAIAELHYYLRGRNPKDLIERLRAGVEDARGQEPLVFRDEMEALQWMLTESRPRDVIAIAALGQRTEVLALLSGRGALRVSPERVRELAQAARRI